MTHHARLILADCQFVAASLSPSLPDMQWRAQWSAGLALIGAISPALLQLDCPTELHSACVEAAMASWQSDSNDVIYRDFICQGMSAILAEYWEESLDQDVDPSHSCIKSGPIGSSTASNQSVRRNLVALGPWAGQEKRILLLRAIAWWGRQLDDVDESFNALGIGAVQQP